MIPLVGTMHRCDKIKGMFTALHCNYCPCPIVQVVLDFMAVPAA